MNQYLKTKVYFYSFLIEVKVRNKINGMADYFLLCFKLLKDEHESKTISRGRKLTIALGNFEHDK